jgi:hypothetical protein
MCCHATAERAILMASSQRRERIVSLSRQARLKFWIELFRGVMQKPPNWNRALQGCRLSSRTRRQTPASVSKRIGPQAAFCPPPNPCTATAWVTAITPPSWKPRHSASNSASRPVNRGLGEKGRYSEFRNIPSCRFLPMADADKARSAELLNSEYSCQPNWPPL